MLETAKDILLALCLLGIAALAIAMALLAKYLRAHLEWHQRNQKPFAGVTLLKQDDESRPKRPTTVCDEGSCDVRPQPANRQAK